MLAEIIPDRSRIRHDIGLVAAIGDDVMRALRQRQVLAAKIDADIHKFDAIQRTAPIPGVCGGMGCAAMEGIFHRHHAIAAHAPHGAEHRRDMDIDAGIHV